MATKVLLTGHHLPGVSCGGYTGVHVGVQRGREPHGLVAADAPRADFDLEVELVRSGDGLDFRGPFVHGGRAGRFLYLTWGEVKGEGHFAMFRRAKLWLSDVDPALWESGLTLHGELPTLTDRAGLPLCASIRPPHIQWSALV